MILCDVYPVHPCVIGSASGARRYITVQEPEDGFKDGPIHISLPYRIVGVVYVGGNSNSNSSNAPNYGLSYANCNNDLSNSNSNIGGRLAIVLEDRPGLTSITVIRAPRECEIQEKSKPGLVALLVTVRVENKGYGSMPNRIGELKAKITSMDNLESAADIACKSRKDKLEVARFEADRKNKLELLQKQARSGTIPVPEYRFFTRVERGKVRDIADLPLYPHRIWHQALAQVLEPLLDSRMIYQSFASRVDHGTQKAVVLAWNYVQHEKIKYCLSLDIKKCYESTDKEVLKRTLRHYLKDDWLLLMLDHIIDEYPRPGISIGDRLSPLFCNLMLTPPDHYAKETLHCHCYIGYADNRFVFGNSKQWLKKIEVELEAQFNAIGYTIKPNWVIADLRTEGVDFLGYRMFKTHILLRRRTKIRLRRAMNEIRKKLESGQFPDDHDRGVLGSYFGVLKWCNGYNLYRRYIWPVKRMLDDYDRWLDGARAYRAFVDLNSEVYL